MASLVRVLMLEFQAADGPSGPGEPQPLRDARAGNARREIQLELFGLLTEIGAKRRAKWVVRRLIGLCTNRAARWERGWG